MLSKSENKQCEIFKLYRTLQIMEPPPDWLPEPASMKIQFLFYIICIVFTTLLDMLLGSFLHPTFSCRDISPIFTVTLTIVPKKRETESPTSSRSEHSDKMHFALR
jgi:hypothetical protein